MKHHERHPVGADGVLGERLVEQGAAGRGGVAAGGDGPRPGPGHLHIEDRHLARSEALDGIH